MTQKLGKINDDERRRVTGEAVYAGDVRAEGALYAGFARSTHASAIIESIDTRLAEQAPGVVGVITGPQLGDRRFGRFTRDYPVLAHDRVLFIGQPVVAIAATSALNARRAAELVRIDYAPLPAVLTAADALRPDAPVVHPGYAQYVNAIPNRQGPNLQGSDELVEGDPEAAFAECDDIYEHLFAWPRSQSAALETHTCLIDASGDRVHVYAAHKEPYKLRRDLAALSDRPESDFAVHPVKIGGDFGGKGVPFIEGACYFLSAATGRPIRGSLTFGEELTSTGGRHSGTLRLRTGLRNGRIHAHEADFCLDGGAFVALKPMPKGILPLMKMAFGHYSVPHRRERAVGVYTNTLPGAHVRSPGEFQAIFAAESHVDIIARTRGEDPIEFRRRQQPSSGIQRVLDLLSEEMRDWPERGADEHGRKLGTGLSVFHRGGGAGESTVRLRASSDGLRLTLAVPDQGAGSFLAFRTRVAERLGVPLARVEAVAAGTDSELVDWGAGASRVTVIVGRACDDACDSLLASLGSPPADPGEFWPADALRALSIPDDEAVEVLGVGAIGRGETEVLKNAYGALAVQVAVDPETGITRATRALLVADTGPVINPVGHRGQLEGGFVYGLSQTLFEELRSENGAVVADSFYGYKIASNVDVPPLKIRLVEPEESEFGDFSAVRAVGELVNIGVPAAVANAIDDAVGVRLLELPLSAERVLRGVQAAG